MLRDCQYETLQGIRDGVAVVASRDPVGARPHLGPAVFHGHAQAGHAQHFDVILLVAEGNHFVARDALFGDPGVEAPAFAVAGVRDIEAVVRGPLGAQAKGRFEIGGEGAHARQVVAGRSKLPHRFAFVEHALEGVNPVNARAHILRQGGRPIQQFVDVVTLSFMLK